MKKIRRAEFLLAVAIVTSAAVLQIREHMLKAPAQSPVAALSCGAVQPGLAPASCAVTRSERAVEGAPRTHQTTPQIWV